MPFIAEKCRATGTAELISENLLTAQSESTLTGASTCLALLALPFDTAREQYASAVRAGLFPASALASRDFELALYALERAALGPLARHT